MAIEEFGQSLLAQQRRRNEQRRKEAERNQLQGLLLKVGLTVGNKLLANRTQRFMNSTEVKSAARVARASDALIADNMRIWDAIDASGKDPLQYLIDQNKPIAQQEINNQFTFKDRGTQDYEATIYKTAKQMAQDQLAALNKMRAIRMDNNLGKDEQRIQTLAKELRPSTVQDAIIGKLTGIFEGFTGQDADENELLSFEEYINDQDPASRGYLIKKYQALGEEYRRSGSLEKAHQTARDIMANKSNPADGEMQTITSKDFEVVNGVMYEIEVKQDYRIKADGSRVKFGEPSRVPLRGEDGKLKVVKLESEADRIRVQMDAFDWQDFIDKNFTAPAKTQIFNGMRDADIRSFGEIDTQEEYDTFQKILYTLGSNPSAYILPEEGMSFLDSGIKEWHQGEGKRIQAKISAAEGRGEDTTEMYKEYNISFGQYVSNLREQARNLTPELRPQGLEGPATSVIEQYNSGKTILVTEELAKLYPSLKDKIGQFIRKPGEM